MGKFLGLFILNCLNCWAAIAFVFSHQGGPDEELMRFHGTPPGSIQRKIASVPFLSKSCEKLLEKAK